MKKCASCRKYKVNGAFNKSKKAIDGLQSWCRDCQFTYNETRRVAAKIPRRKFSKKAPPKRATMLERLSFLITGIK